ncbi:MAG: tetratricopeptide repeat protein [Thermodesulfobacterium sp.]|nr:tetratricopeptide repeat protein [Thermodesulfobacterium sp.]
MAYLYKGEYDLAIKDFNKAIELNPNLAVVYNNRGLAYAALKQWEWARLDLTSAIRKDPKNIHAYYHLAFVLYKMGLLEEARSELHRAAEFDPKILEKRGKFLLKPISERTLRFYAEEYLFASNYLKAPEKYLARARAILGFKEKSPTLAHLAVKPLSKNCIPSYPNRYLLAVLVSSYDELPGLPFVRNDKELILKLATCFLGVPKNQILILEDPTLATFRRKSREFLSEIRKNDAVVFFYYSGHGVMDWKGRFYLLPRDASVRSETDLIETSLSLAELEKKLSLARGMKLAMIDACRVKVPWKPAVLMAEDVGRKDLAVVFTTAPGKISVAEKRGRFSAFLMALYRIASRGIENLDFDGSGYVELKELVKPLEVQVEKASGVEQKPDIKGGKNIPVFPVQ